MINKNCKKILYGEQKAGLYIHIPFCCSKCNYCDFYSTVAFDEKKVSSFVSACFKYIKYFSEKYPDIVFDSIYFGGGTPTIIGEKLADLLNCVKNNFKISSTSEITFEANPESMNFKLLSSLKKAGFNRISIGMQSENDKMLKVLGRAHNKEKFEEAFYNVRRAGFDNISVDMMYALPEQSVDDVIKTSEYLCSLGPSHISAYALKIEKNTPFAKCGNLKIAAEDEQYEMYSAVIEILKKYGYYQYEISNFAKGGKYSFHNMKYWIGADYLGIGPSAYSKIGSERFHIAGDLTRFENFTLDNIETDEILNGEDLLFEYIMLSLRTVKGMDLSKLKAILDNKNYSYLTEKLKLYSEKGFMTYSGGFYSLTARGMWLSNEIISEILNCIF